MSFDKDKIVVGMAKVYINGALVGYTSEDGVDHEASSQDIVKVKAAESLGTIANFRSGIERQIMFSLLQMDPNLLKWALGLDPSVTVGAPGAGITTLALKYSNLLPTLNVMFVVTMSEEGRTISYETTAQPVEQGALGWKKTDVTTLEVTLEELMDVTTNTFGTYTFTDGTETALSISTFLPADEAASVAVESAIEVTFNLGIAYHSLNNGNFMLFEVGAGNELTPVPCTYAFKLTAGTYNHAIVVITPDDDLEVSTTYLLVVGANVMSVTGKRLGAPTEIDFATEA